MTSFSRSSPYFLDVSQVPLFSRCPWDHIVSPLFTLHSEFVLSSSITTYISTSTTLKSTSSTPNFNYNIQPIVCFIKSACIPSSITITFHLYNTLGFALEQTVNPPAAHYF